MADTAFGEARVGFQAPRTFEKALAGIQSRQYVLPAIQREFVCGRDQISMLFDSLMRGRPIGPFLFWDVKEARAADYVFYDCVGDHHELNGPYAQTVRLPPDTGTTAILDGQRVDPSCRASRRRRRPSLLR